MVELFTCLEVCGQLKVTMGSDRATWTPPSTLSLALEKLSALVPQRAGPIDHLEFGSSGENPQEVGFSLSVQEEHALWETNMDP